MIKSWSKRIPLEQQFSGEELFDCDLDCPLRGYRKRQLHVDLTTTLNTMLGDLK